MGGIEDIVNDPGWRPSSGEPVAVSRIQIPAHSFILQKRETIDVTVEVRALKNGLLYATAVDENGMPTLARGSHPIENFPKGQSPYQLINLVRAEREGVPGLAATFEYKAGKTTKGLGEAIPEGLDAARLEYTTWYNPAHGLILLTSVQAHQLVKEGWIDVQLSLPTYRNSERAMTMEASSSMESLRFGRDGTLEKQAPRLFWTSPELNGIYESVTNGAQVDPLRTAVALINGFPTQRPLNMELLIQYTSQIKRR